LPVSQMYDMAIKDCEKAVTLKPDFAKAFSRLGTAHFQAGRFREAIDKGYKKALELEPGSAQVRAAPHLFVLMCY
jgi:small glutamine-rich tetratricopeptide repeat-containing protein alpha